jgi:hypothetical protein
MKISGGRQRLCMGGWILAALVVLGLNLFQFMSLEQQPLVGYSQTVKVLQAQLREFDNAAATGVFELKDRMRQIEAGAWFSARRQTTDPPGTAKAAAGTPIADAAEILLPTLSGIIQTLDPRGGTDFHAVLNGRVCRMRDKIDEFTVVKISPDTVVVRRAGRNWILNNPAPYFSSDQGE